MLLKNTGKTPAYIQIVAAGNSTSSGLFFTLKSPVTLLAPGTSITLTLSQPLTSASIGLKYNFVVNLFYGSGIDASGNIINPTVTQVVRSTFTVVA